VHANRTWHLDISPDNIMIRAADGAPILLDFGASRFEIKQHSQLVSALVFKSGYSAPEQYTSNADRYGAWTDIYAFGATVYRAIAGSRPIEATSRQIQDELTPVEEVGRGRYRPTFLKAVDWALELRPRDRPQNIAQWRKELLAGGGPVPLAKTRVLEGRTRIIGGPDLPSPTPVLPPAPVPKPSRQIAFERRGVAIGALCVLLLGAAISADRYAPELQVNPITYVKKAAAYMIGPGPARTPQCNNASESCWGVIVEKNGGIFARIKEPTKEEAENGAMNLCAEKVGPGGCRVTAVLTKKECWALFEVPSNPADYRSASGPTVDDAKASAKAACEGNYGYCRIGMTFCADGSNRIGGSE
jgi:hypothetical protein